MERSALNARIEFRCPECGSALFGSSQEPDGSLLRFCHGRIVSRLLGGTQPCRFRWPQADDWKHFVYSFADRGDFEETRAAMLAAQGIAVVRGMPV